ncbi:MAG TPA: T9SS type A sorting domain-containing protein [Bacteroidales bacterium]|nr:T9SS type A sorting domain-containing protein [Bacteroidales bacterium]
MKKFYFIISFMLMASLVGAQNLRKSADNMGSGEDKPDSAFFSYYLGQWVTKDKFVFTYDDEENTVQWTAFHRELNSEPWQLNERVIDKYHVNGYKLSHIDLFYNPEVSEFENRFSNVYTYDASGKMTGMFSFNWNDAIPGWDSTGKYEYSYTVAGDSMVEYVFEKNLAEDIWSLRYMDEVLYTPSGKEKIGTGFQWNSVENKWDTTNEYRYYYDENDNDTLYRLFDYNDEGVSELSFEMKTEYNDQGQKMHIHYYGLESAVWKYSGKSDLFYNESGNLTQRITYNWDDEAGEYLPSFKETNYYDGLTEIASLKPSDILIFPNPASDFLAVNLNKPSSSVIIKIFNLNGNLVLQKQLRDQEHIQVGHLPGGVYVYEVLDSGNIVRGKITICK